MLVRGRQGPIYTAGREPSWGEAAEHRSPAGELRSAAEHRPAGGLGPAVAEGPPAAHRRASQTWWPPSNRAPIAAAAAGCLAPNDPRDPVAGASGVLGRTCGAGGRCAAGVPIPRRRQRPCRPPATRRPSRPWISLRGPVPTGPPGRTGNPLTAGPATPILRVSGRIAQRQSTCFTRRGPQVQILFRPPCHGDDGAVAQSVEQRTENPRVAGSIPACATTEHLEPQGLQRTPAGRT